MGGSVGACLFYSTYVAKSRIQNTVIVGGNAKAQQQCLGLSVVAEIAPFRREKGLYRGFVPKLLRLGPGGGILLLAFDWALQVINMN